MRFTVGIVISLGILAATTGGEARSADEVIAEPQAGFRVSHQSKCNGGSGYSAVVGGSRNLLWRPEWLALQKAAIGRNAKRLNSLQSAADAALLRGPYSVRHKIGSVSGADSGDYVSVGPYWWPDPNAPNGLPYVRRDGETNPERDSERFDSKRLDALADDLMLLALAGHHLGEERYRAHAATLVRTWFIDQNSRMNPHLDFAQAVPGRSAGRSFGVIDAVRLIEVAESIALLESAGSLTAVESAEVRRWFGDLAKWMITSKNGQAAAVTTNNHSLYFDLMLTHFSLFSGADKQAAEIIEVFPLRRLSYQIDPSGRLPKELARSRGWSYSVFALKAALQMAMLGECVGINLWNWRTSDGKSLRAAVDFLVAHRRNLDDWQKPDLDLDHPAGRAKAMKDTDQLFRLAAWGWRDPDIDPNGATDYLLPEYRQ